jgi:RNA polymerase sigma-70 factor (ECF subfamily)
MMGLEADDTIAGVAESEGVFSPDWAVPSPIASEYAGDWVDSLKGPRQEETIDRLHALLLRAARHELRRRNLGSWISGPECDDLAHQAAADAVVSISRRIDDFRGESRFTTWAYKFVILEVSSKLGRHFWANPSARREYEDWEHLPDRFGISPSDFLESKDLVDAIRESVETSLTVKQREVFVALVVDGVPLDALTVKLATSRNALYKMMFDARRKLRKDLSAKGYVKAEDAR